MGELIRVKGQGGAILGAGLALILLIAALADFNVFGDFNLSYTISPILTIVAVLFIFAEQGIKASAKGMNAMRGLVLVVGILALVGALAALFGFGISVLAPIMGIVKIVLMLLFVYSVFTE